MMFYEMQWSKKYEIYLFNSEWQNFDKKKKQLNKMYVIFMIITVSPS